MHQEKDLEHMILEPPNSFLRRLCVPAILIACVFIGCKTETSPVVGKWKGHQGVYLLKPDYTFTVGEEPRISSGTWTYVSGKLNLRYDRIGGQTIDEYVKVFTRLVAKSQPSMTTKEGIASMRKEAENATFNLSEDGSSLFPNPPKAGGSDPLTRIEANSSK